MKCLVTGAAGFIGNKLVQKLVKEGYEVVALIHKTKPNIILKDVKYFTGDITKIDSIRPLFKDIDFVFHCAAIVKDYGPKKQFYKVNLEGTKILAKLSKEFKIKKFVYLSHIRYESEKSYSFYSKTKKLAEEYLLEKYNEESLPVVIIRPGNVFGPGATTWVLRPIEQFKKNRISLIDNGQGIFQHTYIDNLLTAMIAVIKKQDVLGEMIDITDGDNNTTWKIYFDDLARIIGKPKIKKNMSKKIAYLISLFMMGLNKIFKIEPWVTPMVVQILSNKSKISIVKATKLLGYHPKVDYQEGLKNIEKWIKKEKLIN